VRKWQEGVVTQQREAKWTEAKRLTEAGMESCSEEDIESEDEVDFLAELEFDMPDCD
jgi:hypothetical protein